ncbi:MAG: LytR/AlgR family response regulator transcription factor [Luteibaculum sp.]
MRIAIAEDEFIVAEQLRQFVEWAGHEVLAVEHSKATFSHALIGLQIDLALLDIRMEDSNSGFEIAKELTLKKIPFIFISAHSDEQTLRTASKLNPIGYITKPFNKAQIKATLATLEPQIEEAVVELKSGREIHRIKLNEIFYVKADNVYCELYTKAGRIVVRSSLKALEPLLVNNHIKRCHRSYLVNTQWIEIKGVENLKVNGDLIPWSKKYPI